MQYLVDKEEDCAKKLLRPKGLERESLIRYWKGDGKVIYHTHLQSLNGSLSKIKGS